MVQESDVVFICVKPYLVGAVLDELKGVVTEKHLLVSVAAGVPIIFMEEVILCFQISC